MYQVQIISTVSPFLGTALGSPVGGVILKEIAGKVFGKEDATEEEMENFIAEATPEQILAMKEIANTRKERELRERELELEDTLDAREKMDTAIKFLGIFCIIYYLSMPILLAFIDIPEDNEDFFGRFMGGLDFIAHAIIGAFFGNVMMKKINKFRK